MGFDGIQPLVSTWLEHPRTEWRLKLLGKSLINGPFSSTPCLMTPEGVKDRSLSYVP